MFSLVKVWVFTLIWSAALVWGKPAVKIFKGDSKDADTGLAITRLGLRHVSFDSLPGSQRSHFESLLVRTGDLLAKMSSERDGNAPIKLVLVDRMDPNAFFMMGADGEKIIGVHLGLFNYVDNDAELAYVLTHELEHAHSVLQKEADLQKAKGQFSGFLLERVVENEVDIEAARRLIEMGYSPHAAVDFLNRLRAKFGDVGSKTHTLLSNRIDSIGAAITVLVRGFGKNEEHRLDNLPRPREVVAGAKEALHSKNFLDYKKGLVQELLKAEKAGSPEYSRIKTLKKDDPFEAKGSFDSDFKLLWSEIKSHLVEPLSPREEVDLRLKLYKNLDAEYAKSREEILGKSFHADNSTQVKALLAQEERSYELNTPNIFESAYDYFKALKTLEKAEAKKPLDEGEVRVLRVKMTEARDSYELSKYPYEPNPDLDEKLKAIYEEDSNRLHNMTFEARWDTPRNEADNFESLGLKLREVEDLFRGEKERIDNVRKTVMGPKLDPDLPLREFIAELNPAGRRDHSLQEYREILDTFEKILKREFAPGRKKHEYDIAIDTLCDHHDRNFDVFWFRYRALEPEDTDRRLLDTIQTMLESTSDPTTVSVIRDFFESHKRLLSEDSQSKIDTVFDKKVAEGYAENIQNAKDLRELVQRARQLRESFHDPRTGRKDGGIKLKPDASRKIRDAISKKLRSYSKNLTTSQSNTLSHILIPALMTDVGEAHYDRMARDMIAISKSPELSKHFDKVLSVKEVVYAFNDRIHPNSKDDEKAYEAFYARRKTLVDRFRSTFRQIERMLNYDQAQSLRVTSMAEFINGYLEKMQGEEPDLKLAKKLADQESWTKTYDSLKKVMSSTFQTYLKRYPKVSDATFEFWKAVDEAGIAPTYDDLNGISQIYNEWLPGKEKVKVDGREQEILNPKGVKFFLGFLEGAKRFQEHVNQNGRRATYSKPTGKPFEEVSHRVNFEQISRTIAHAESRAKMGTLGVLDLYQRLLEVEQAPYPSPEHDAILEELWAMKEKYPEVQKFFNRPEIVGRAFYHSNQMKIARWQLEQVPGYTSFLPGYRSGNERLPQKETVRPIIGEVVELIKRQFPKLVPARNEILNHVENKLLPNEAETKILNENKVNNQNWKSSSFLIAADAPALANKGLKDNQERLEVLRYLIGLDKNPPSLPDRSFMDLKQKSLGELLRSYRENGTVFRMLCLGPLLDDQEGILSDPKLEAEILKIILGKSYNNPALLTLAQTYLSVLPPTEKKALITKVLAGFEPGAKSSGSIKQLLSAGGPLGAKGGQGLLTSGMVSEETRADFMEFFDEFLKPEREKVFEHLKSIFGDSYISIEGLAEIPGSGSLNYVAKVVVKDPQTGKLETVVVRVQKDNVPALIRNENKVWEEVHKRLVNHEDPVVRRLSRLIEEVRLQAISTLNYNGTELDLEREREKYAEAKAAYNNPVPDKKTGFTVEAVRPNDRWQKRMGKDWQKRASVYEYVDSIKIEDVADPRLRRELARQIIEAEHKARQKGTFDPDGHLRNWLIDLKGKRLVRIDTAQLLTLPPEQIDTYNALMGKLLGVSLSDRGGLAKYIAANYQKIFEGVPKLNDFEKVIDRIAREKRLPPVSNPIERLLFIQDALENHYQSHGSKGINFPLAKGVKHQILAEMRVAMFKRYSGKSAYVKNLAQSIQVGRLPLLAAQMRATCFDVLKRAGSMN